MVTQNNAKIQNIRTHESLNGDKLTIYLLPSPFNSTIGGVTRTGKVEDFQIVWYFPLLICALKWPLYSIYPGTLARSATSGVSNGILWKCSH